MKTKIILLLLLISHLNYSQNDKIIHTIDVVESQTLNDILWFQKIDFLKLNFINPELKGKNYRITIKEFKKGQHTNTDTIIDTSLNKYTKKISSNNFQIRVIAKELEERVKVNFHINNMMINHELKIDNTGDVFALKDFTGGKNSLEFEYNTAANILSYILPYEREGQQIKFYCEVAESKFKPEQWGKIFNIPQYFLIQIEFIKYPT